MTINIIKANTSTKFFKALEGLAPNDNHVFRGHKYSKWHLTSTLARHRRAPYHPTMSWDVDEMPQASIHLSSVTCRWQGADGQGWNSDGITAYHRRL
jgi:hypothetical protein